MANKGTTLTARLLATLGTVVDTINTKIGTNTDAAGTTTVFARLRQIYDAVTSLVDAGELFSKSGPTNIEMDDVGVYSLELYDIGGDVPTAGEITPGNYQIDRIRDGVTTNIVASTAASESTGRIYCSETFDVGSGWAVGDLVLVTFSGGSIVITDGETTVLPNAYFYTRIVRGEVIDTKIGTNTDAVGTTTIFARLRQIVDTYLADATIGLSALNDDLDVIIANQAGEETIDSYNLPNDLAENDAIEIVTGVRQRLDSVWLDFVNLTQDVTIKVYHKIDGTTYRQYDEFSWATSEEDGVLIRDITINSDWKLSITSTVVQGGIKAIPYNVIMTTMEA